METNLYIYTNFNPYWFILFLQKSYILAFLHVTVRLFISVSFSKMFWPKAVDETFLRTLAVNLCKDWQQLADKLKFRPAEIGKFKRLAESNPEEQAHQMLVSWWSKQSDSKEEAGEWLRSALAQIGRPDLAAKIPG